jgi:hypothetical protein
VAELAVVVVKGTMAASAATVRAPNKRRRNVCADSTNGRPFFRAAYRVS